MNLIEIMMLSLISKRFLYFYICGLILTAVTYGLSANRPVYIDKDGVMRWQDNNDEVALFGVNYCLPSGYSFRAVQYVGADHKRVIDADMAHLARMELDALRLSFWGDWGGCEGGNGEGA